MSLLFGATEDMTMEERISIALENGKCVFCDNRFNYKCHTPKSNRNPGTVYSKEGLREIAISGICEFCFDKLINL
jgi:hypothetical protein